MLQVGDKGRQHYVKSGEVKDIVLAIGLAKDELGWNPETDMEDGLKETWDWFKENVVSDKVNED